MAAFFYGEKRGVTVSRLAYFLSAILVFTLAPMVASADDTSGRLVIGAEATYLEPRMGSLQFLNNPSAVDSIQGYTPDFAYAVAPRFWLGFQRSDGLGIRARYWQFQETAAGISFRENSVQLSLDIETLDLEFTQDVYFRNWEFEVAGGARYGRMALGFDGLDSGEMSGEASFDGIGPTIAMSARRPFRTGKLALVGGVRGSFLFGDTRLRRPYFYEPFAGDGIYVAEHLMQIWECQIGVEWSHETKSGLRWSARAVYETQVWNWSPSLGLFDMNVGLVGPACSLQVAW
jgi:hypothetical protein